jgi:DNA-binding transcriptional regulator LsrR (DeoR family)
MQTKVSEPVRGAPQPETKQAGGCDTIDVMPHLDEVRLMTKVARMYYDQGLRQKEITERLSIHQSTVSRLLQRARQAGVVRITVSTPSGIFSEIEDALERTFGLKEAIVIESRSSEEHLVQDLGTAAAFFLQTTVKPGDMIGISSWSRALFAMVDSMHSSDCARGGKVVQILGGFGIAGTQYQATHLAQRLAERIGATPALLQAPALVGTAEARRVLMRDSSVSAVADMFPKLNLSAKEREALRQAGAVGDICFRFFDRSGKALRSPLNNRVVGIDLATLEHIDRVVGIAGGPDKRIAIHAALLARRVNVLITDFDTAKSFL